MRDDDAGQRDLGFAKVGAAESADAPVGPWLSDQPIDRVRAVIGKIARHGEYAFRCVPPPNVLHGEHKAPGPKMAQQISAISRLDATVRSLDVDGGQWRLASRQDMDVHGHPSAVAHGNHDVALDVVTMPERCGGIRKPLPAGGVVQHDGSGSHDQHKRGG